MTSARNSPRTPLTAEVLLRRVGGHPYRVRIFDLSPHGCKVEFVERPQLDEQLWVKLEGIETLQGSVCWIKGHTAGIEFERPVHAAVFELLVKRLTQSASGLTRR